MRESAKKRTIILGHVNKLCKNISGLQVLKLLKYAFESSPISLLMIDLLWCEETKEFLR